MEEAYQLIIEYKKLNPFRFWTAITLIFIIIGLIISFLRRSKADDKKTKINISKSEVISSESSRTNTEKIEKGKLSLAKTLNTKKKESELKETSNSYQPPAKEKPISKPKIETRVPKPVTEEYLPLAKEETEGSKNQILKVNYNSSKLEQTNVYPIFRCPKPNTVVRSYREGSTKRRGFKEDVFQNAIQEVFGNLFSVSGELRINTGKNTRPFEPDIALIGKKNNNIRIDIEIDEPYGGINRKPTHCKGDDVLRDTYFIDRGWIVIRFSEYQVHMFEKQCLKFILDVINSISKSLIFPEKLIQTQSVDTEKLWDIVQAQKWEKANYREQYLDLDHVFQITKDRQETNERDFNEQEEEEEKLVKPTSIGVEDKTPLLKFNLINAHPRDKRIKFYPEPHSYTIDASPAPSVSNVISKFFPEFDSYGIAATLSPSNPLFGLSVEEIVETWHKSSKDARDKGAFLHEQIEKYYLGEKYEESEEFHLFKKFVSEHKDIKPYRSEWRVFDEEYSIAGTIDLISKNSIGYDIYDWKRSKKVVDTDHPRDSSWFGKPIKVNAWGRVGIGKLKDIDDTSYNRYCLQQSLYKFILEKNYNLKISKMFLVVLYPEYDNYYKVEVPYWKDWAEYLLKTL